MRERTFNRLLVKQAGSTQFAPRNALQPRHIIPWGRHHRSLQATAAAGGKRIAAVAASRRRGVAVQHYVASSRLKPPIRLPGALQVLGRRIQLAMASTAASAADAAMETTQKLQHRQQEHHPLLEAINDATKWAVSTAALATLLWRRDLLTAWCLLGSVVAALTCRILKFAVNQARPSERKADPGMPSAHANSLSFLAMFIALASYSAIGASTAAGLLLVLGVPAIAAFLTWLRVALGYHTVPQVLAGWLVGGCSAAAWHSLGRYQVLPGLQRRTDLQAVLWLMTGIAIALFIFYNVRRWFMDAQQLRQRQQQQQQREEEELELISTAEGGG